MATFGLILAAPPVAAVQYEEGFESFAAFSTPSSASYTFSTGGTGSGFVSTAQAQTGTKSLQVATTNGNSFRAQFLTATLQNNCDDAASPTNSNTATWGFRMPALPTAGRYEMGISSAAQDFEGVGVGEFIGLAITTTGDVQAFYHDNGGSTIELGSIGLTASVNTWYTFQIECGGQVQTYIRWRELTTGTQLSTSADLDLAKGYFIADIDTATGNTNYFIDNLNWDFAASSTGPGVRFCANPLETDYAYTYRRGGDYFDQAEADEPGIGLSTGYGFDGTSSESTWDYSAKQFTTGSEAMHANITLEAAVDFGASSVFRVNFATVSGATPSVTTKGDGLTTGNFADHVEAEFTENGNVWQIKLWYVTGGGTRTQLGAAVNHGSANDARSYSIWSDNRGSTPWIAVKDSAGATVITSNSTAPGTLATFQTAFTGDDIFDIWYVGYGTGILDATTAIDNNEAEAGNSTCMFDDVGTAVTQGSAGTSPADLTPPDIDPTPEEDCVAVFCPPAGGIGGLSSSQVSLFLGIVIVASFAASMNEKTGAGAAGLAIFALLGTFIAYALGYIPLWVILVLFAIGLGAIFLGLFNSGKSEAT